MGNAAESRSNVDFRRSERIFVLFLNKLPQTFGPSSFIGRIMWSYSFQKR